MTQERLVGTRAKRLDFYGHAVHDTREEPFPLSIMARQPRGVLLPITALYGVELHEYRPRDHGGADPYVLYDRYGKIIHQWPDDYIPSWVDVYEVCASLGLV